MNDCYPEILFHFMLFILRLRLPAQLTGISIAFSDDDDENVEVAAMRAMVDDCRYCIYMNSEIDQWSLLHYYFKGF